MINSLKKFMPCKSFSSFPHVFYLSKNVLYHMTIEWKNNGTPQRYFLEENVFFYSPLPFFELKNRSVWRNSTSKAFKEGALCDIFIPIEKFVPVLKAMREAGIFRPVCKVKSMSLLLFFPNSSLPNNPIKTKWAYQNAKMSKFQTMRLWSFSESYCKTFKLKIFACEPFTQKNLY